MIDTPNRRPPERKRAVLVTGTSSGIGRAIAERLARDGFVVFATVREEADAHALEALGLPDLVPLCPLDLTIPEHITAIRDRVADALAVRGQPGLYAVINNAGGGGPAPVELLDVAVLRRELEIRVVGGVEMVQAFLPLLRLGEGRIVWIVTPAVIPTPYVAAIHACDFAVNCLARTLDIELKRWRIPSIQIRCGGIRTPAGLRTTADVRDLLGRVPPQQAGLYAEQLRAWAEEMQQFDERRTDAGGVAAVVSRALRTRSPKRRYSVGHMSRVAAMLELLPQSLADRVLRARF